ncbi:hypothetical protein FHN55_19810 [Streptomyces sp. NP160]|uniref:hypothetical protein n=1 Tax=Streptomyces sp. NP160 TaxID=2586637 RepID=UPI00111B7077|nr:hypothetical protein [Streptomyces sp. NP160]TNM60035.1 hypothetical protein FHN55_19810 [Streptomyces sp. NP160]
MRSGERPTALVVAVGVVAAEALALVAVVVFYGVELSRGAAAVPTGAVATAVLAAALAVGLVLCSRALLGRSRWGRAPLITWQLFQVVLTAPLVTGPLWPVAAVFVVLAVVAGVCLASRALSVWVGDDDAAGPPVH